MHPTLERQLRKLYGSAKKAPKDCEGLLQAVDRTYRGYDDDRELMEHSLGVSSRELQEANRQLMKESEQVRQEKKTMEAMYRSVVTAMAEGAVFQDAAGKILAVNPAAERIIGKSAEQMMGHTTAEVLREMYDENGRPFSKDRYPSAITLRTGVPQRDVRERMGRQDGTSVWISANTEPLVSAKGAKPYAVVITFHDITERKRGEEALKEGKADMAQKIAELERMNAVMVGRELKMLELKERIKELSRAPAAKRKAGKKK